MAAQSVLMIRPVCFGFNRETAASNVFQHDDDALTAGAIQARARTEFDGLAAALRKHGVDVLCFDDTPDPPKPDAVFPNNWISLHDNGDVVLYPMSTPNRRAEIRHDIVASLRDAHGFVCRRVHDLTDPGALGGVLEGTGSLVLDRGNRVAYACLSVRTEAPAVHAFCRHFEYEPVLFHAFDSSGARIYHTNVLMTLGPGFAVVCLDSLGHDAERHRLVSRLEAGGRHVVDVSVPEMRGFAANLLALQSATGEALLVGSENAFATMRDSVRAKLATNCRLVSAPLATIERYGGGSARCMLAEIDLPRVPSAIQAPG